MRGKSHNDWNGEKGKLQGLEFEMGLRTGEVSERQK